MDKQKEVKVGIIGAAGFIGQGHLHRIASVLQARSNAAVSSASEITYLFFIRYGRHLTGGCAFGVRKPE